MSEENTNQNLSILARVERLEEYYEELKMITLTHEHLNGYIVRKV